MRLILSFVTRLCLLLCSAWMVSCAGPQYVEAAVEGFAGDGPRLASMQTFRYAGRADGEHALRDRALFEEMAILLEARGLRRVDSPDAQLHIHLRAQMDETTIVLPAHYEMGRRFSPGYFRTAYVRGSDGKLHPEPIYCPGGWESAPYRVPASSIPAYAHRLDVSFHDAEDTLLWQGSIDVIDRSRDLFQLLSLFLPDLLEEYPSPSGRGIERRALRAPQSADLDSSS